MLIRFIWKDCDICSEDAYWLEASEQEAKRHIFPLLDDDDIAQSIKFSENAEHLAEMMGNPEHTFCFLISQDTTFIRPFQVHYPVHQLWNAYSPFEEIDEIEIVDLSEIKYKTYRHE